MVDSTNDKQGRQRISRKEPESDFLGLFLLYFFLTARTFCFSILLAMNLALFVALLLVSGSAVWGWIGLGEPRPIEDHLVQVIAVSMLLLTLYNGWKMRSDFELGDRWEWVQNIAGYMTGAELRAMMICMVLFGSAAMLIGLVAVGYEIVQRW